MISIIDTQDAMKDKELQNTKHLANDGQLTLKYILIWILVAVLTAFVVSITAYSILRSHGIQTTVEKMLEVIPHATNFIELEPGESESKPHASAFRHFSQTPSIVESTLYAVDGEVLAASNPERRLSKQEHSQGRALFEGKQHYFINDTPFYTARFWQDLIVTLSLIHI